MISITGFDFAGKRERALQSGDIPAAVSEGWYAWVDAEAEPPAGLRPVLDALGFDAAAAAEALESGDEVVYRVLPRSVYFYFNEVRFANDELLRAPVHVLLNERGMITFHAGPVALIAHLRQTYREDFLAYSRSHGFLVFELADHLVDGYRSALLSIGESVQRVQMQLFSSPDDDIFRSVADLTRQILECRKSVTASRELLHELASRRSPFIPESTQPFVETLAGTLDRLAGDLATERDVLTDTLNLYMGMVGHHTSRLLKRLTMISIIFLPLTFLCGVYGMNFRHMPELEWRVAYPAFWAVAAAIVAALLYLMKRSRWL